MGFARSARAQIVQALAKVLWHLNVLRRVEEGEMHGRLSPASRNDLAFQQLAEFNIEQMRAAGVEVISICRIASAPSATTGANSAWIRHRAPPVFLERHNHCYHPRKSPARLLPTMTPAISDAISTCRRPRSVGLGHDDRSAALADSFCCGAGGGLVFLGEEKGKR